MFAKSCVCALTLAVALPFMARGEEDYGEAMKGTYKGYYINGKGVQTGSPEQPTSQITIGSKDDGKYRSGSWDEHSFLTDNKYSFDASDENRATWKLKKDKMLVIVVARFSNDRKNLHINYDIFKLNDDGDVDFDQKLDSGSGDFVKS